MRFFQYRNKNGSRREIYEIAAGLSRLIRDAGALFLVNDHADIALAAGADGVHLGQDDLPVSEARRLLGTRGIIGVSTHSVEEALRAQEEGADYIGFGPLFPTATKDAGPAKGIEGLRAVRDAVSLPIIAIGGISGGNAGEVIREGADGIAVISAVLNARNAGDASRQMCAIIRKAEEDRRGGKTK